MHSQASVEINRPIEEVFDFTTNHITQWSTIVLEDEVIDRTPEVTGTTFHTVTDDRGCKMEFDGVITRHTPPTEHTVSMVGDKFDIIAQYCFETLTADTTRLTERCEVKPKGFISIFFFLFGWAMKKSSCNALQKELDNLKQCLEKQ